MSRCVLYYGDCLDVMPRLAAKSVDMVFADPPYQRTACKWDLLIDTQSLWQNIATVIKRTAVCAITTDMPLASAIMNSATIPYRYDLVLHKCRPTGFLNAKKAPMRAHEHVLIFSRPKSTYNVQMVKTWRPPRKGTETMNERESKGYGLLHKTRTYTRTDYRYPTSVIEPESPASERGLHPTQKLVALLEWLISTYTNPGDTVLDPVFGSNTTAIACARLGRNYIGIEKDADCFRIGAERVNAERAALGLNPATVAH